MKLAPVVVCLALCASGCTTGEGAGENTPVDVEDLEPERDPFLATYAEQQAVAAALSVDDFLTRYPAPPYVASLTYDPMTAVGLDQIDATFPERTPAQTDTLTRNGFVALAQYDLAGFEAGYAQLYDADLPALITTDSILYALHRSFDAMLATLERSALRHELEAMLAQVQTELAAKPLDAPSLRAAAAELDVYVTVARALLSGAPIPSAMGAATDARVAAILERVADAQPADLRLLGRDTLYDYSQMVPRGHYADDPVLQTYFQALMWLGRTDFALVAFDPVDRTPDFSRVAFDAAFLLHTALRDSGALLRWQRVDAALEKLIGEPDSMNPYDLALFTEGLGLITDDDLAAATDAEIFEPLMEQRLGVQRIMSQIMFTNPAAPPLLLPRTFLLLGQRFTIDSYVFNNVTFDRVRDASTGAGITRMLPDELDAMFVLGNDEAAQLLADQLRTYPYQGPLHELRFLVDSHPQDFWDQSFYNGWLAGIRALSAPEAERAEYPEPMRTQAWAHKTLNTQAASRAELRHDTLLYVKQSYSSGNGCEYTGAYVEPAVAFYAQMAHLGDLGHAVAIELRDAGYDLPGFSDYFDNWTSVMGTLEGIAGKELAHEALSGDEVAFLGATIERELVGCGQVAYDGWYPSLFFDPATVGEFIPTVADVHTAPTDELGNPTGWVLHAATARPMLMVLTVPECDGEAAAAFVGPISRYASVLTEGFERLTDEEWGRRSYTDGLTPPEWTRSFAP